MTARMMLLVPLFSPLTACTGAGDRKAEGTSAVTDSVPRLAPASPPAVDPVRPMRPGERGHVAAEAIQWSADVVAAHLTGIGLEAEPMGLVSRPIFRVKGQRFRVMGGRAAVEAFFYGDANAVAQDTYKLDTVLVAPRGGRMAWEMAPRLVIDNNMAAVIMTTDASLRGTIETALHSALHGQTRAP